MGATAVEQIIYGGTTNSGIAQQTVQSGDVNLLGLLIKNTGTTATVGGTLSLARARDTANASVNDDDVLGAIQFLGGDGTDIKNYGALIECEVDGTPGSNDMPGRLTFHTTADGAQVPTERLRIDSSGRLLQGKTATKGSTGENIPTYCTEIASNNPNVVEIANNGTGANAYSTLVLSRSDGTSVNSHTAVDNGDKIGEVCFIGADGSDRFNTAASIFVEAEADYTR